MITTEAARLDPVQAAVKALVEAASASTSAYTVEDLRALVEDAANELAGAGGVAWLIKGLYYARPGASLPERIQRAIPGIRSRLKRDNTLAYIDRRIAGAERVKEHGPNGGANGGGVPKYVTDTRPRTGPHGVDKYISVLRAVRAEVEAVRADG